MPRGISRIEGMAEASRQMREFTKVAQNRIGKRALKAPAGVLVRKIKGKAHVSSRSTNPTPGSLRDSVKDVDARKERGRVTRVIIADDVAAVPNQYGTSKMAPNYFFSRGVDEGRDEAGHAMAGALKQEVDAEVQRIAKG